MADAREGVLRGDETASLRAFLDAHRDLFRRRAAGLDAEALSRTLPPSTMTLGGMVKHLALVEDHWFSVVLHGRESAEAWREVDWRADDDWDWHSAADDTPEQLWALFEEAVAASDRSVDEALANGGLDTPSARTSRHHASAGEAFSLRWILLHMIEEYAQHNGHADLIRESIDGARG